MSETTFKFTEARLKLLPLPPAGQRPTYRDTEVMGLQLRVTPNGVKTFSWYRRPKNEAPQRETIGRSPDVTVIQARAEAQKHNAAIASGESPATERRAKRNEVLFSELFETYIERHAKVHKKTWKEDQQRYDQYLAAPLGRLRVNAIKREAVSSLHAKITAAGHAAVANRVLALVSGVFGRAVEWSIIETNPIKGIRRNREVSRDRFIRSDELPRFFAALMEESNEIVRDFFLMLLLTGARRANVLAMAWADINLDAEVWRIPDTKSGEPVVVPLLPQTMEVLRQRRAADAGSQFVFPGTGRGGHLVEPKKAWQRLFDRDELSQIVAVLEAAGHTLPIVVDDTTSAVLNKSPAAQLERAKALANQLEIDVSGCRMPETRIHDLRRTVGSYLAMNNIPLNIIGKTLGHKNLATTQVYARLQVDLVRDAMTKATAKMFSGIDLGTPADRTGTKS